jgi:hypothetical protein
MTTKYMHTILGRPATFNERQRLILFTGGKIKLVDSLDQIRREQRANIGARIKLHIYTPNEEFNYIRVEV